MMPYNIMERSWCWLPVGNMQLSQPMFINLCVGIT